MAQTALGALNPPRGKGKGKGKGKSPLAQAQNQLANIRRRAKLANIKAAEGASAALGVAEVQGACLLMGMARGYMGTDKVKGVSIPLVLGGGLTAYGLLNAFQGQKMATHLLALGNGVLAAGIVGVGQDLGERIKEGGGVGFAGLAPREAYVTPNTAGRAGLRPRK